MGLAHPCRAVSVIEARRTYASVIDLMTTPTRFVSNKHRQNALDTRNPNSRAIQNPS